MASRLRVEAVLFDLDGTLVDTLPDITWCLNQVLLEHGCPAQTAQTVRGYIGGGVTAMIEQVAERFGIADAVAMHQRYVTLYQNNLVQFSRPFSGVLALLEGCRQLQVPLAIVTNKTEEMALQVADALLPQNTFGTILGHRAGRALKPQPDVAWEAARRLSVDPQRCLFVGDTEIDLKTARAAGMYSAAVTWGYGLPPILRAQAPNFCCEQPAGLLRILQQVCGTAPAFTEHGDTVKSY
ncbi:HAD family hydrolase [Pseudomonas frederiksbergensis]|uniref:phosphoglycolate phosphatase n=1 Tax=Pseudomonas frederiksbergensis TaxID=104087 RepID=A0A423HKF6_9PSED|nr:HAD-IA family hydrolase [Pseudomonas frederiksbergensis]RON13627.1 hydrolase [Pseudomonas frederiksbergensis]RON13758.1 hydrolase [Pseudomonas frederiksbergensis]